MEQQFQLKLISPSKYFVGVLVYLALVAASFVAAVGLTVSKLGIVVAMLSSGLAGYFFLRWLAVYRAVATLTPEVLTVHLVNGKFHMAIVFAEVASYKYKSERTRYVLRFNLFNGTRQKLVADSILGSVGNFWELAYAIDQIAERHYRPAVNSAEASAPAELLVAQQRHPDQKVMAREKGFFEKPVSTITFWLLTSALALALLRSALADEPVPLLGLYVGGWLFYLLPWLLNMDQRIENKDAAKR